MKLKNEILGSLKIPAPNYDRKKITAGIVHFGVGGFHRAHLANYIDELMNKGLAQNFGIIGAGILPQDVKMKDALSSQDCLYTLVAKAPNGEWQPRVIGSIIDYIFGPENPQALLEKLADPEIKIVSLTITEGGYNFDQITGEFIADNPVIISDIKNADAPQSAFAYIYRAIELRKSRGIPPFTVMSMDNIQKNGQVIKKALLSFAKLIDKGEADWIEENISFPSSMVDRITPKTTEKDIADIKEKYGVEDNWPVVTEDFIQWALEDKFTLGRPEFEKVSANGNLSLTEDCLPYELMKLRLLNVSHQGIAYFGWLSGFRDVDDAAKDPEFKKFLKAYMDEASSTLIPIPGIDFESYKLQLLERFANDQIKDTVARLAEEASDRIPKWAVPVVNDKLARGESVQYCAAIIASWARYAKGVDEQGEAIPIVDNAKEQVMKAAQIEDPLGFLSMENFFGGLKDEERFAKPYLNMLKSLEEHGAYETLKKLNNEKI